MGYTLGVVTDGYLNGCDYTLPVVMNGYLNNCIDTIDPQFPGDGEGGIIPGARIGWNDMGYHFDLSEKELKELLMKRLGEEDDEILIIIKAFLRTL